MKNYYPASQYNKEVFGERIQKIPIDAGFTCPNRDGKLSSKGCIYCCNESFSPFYASSKVSITKQIQDGIDFYSKRYNAGRFMAYFQSYTNTYAPIEILRAKYKEAVKCKGIEGLIIATRPDCLSDQVLQLLRELQEETFIRIELGIESFDDQVLKAINRGHDVKCVLTALEKLNKSGISHSVHLIFGLPYEKDNAAENAGKIISDSGAEFVKLHHLQVVKGSELGRLYEEGRAQIKLLSFEDYLHIVCNFIQSLDRCVYIERFINRVPPSLLLAPKWGNVTENQFRTRIEEYLSGKGQQ